MQIETYNILLKPDAQTAEYWKTILETARDAFNHCAKRMVETKSPLSLKAIHALCYAETREMFPTLSSQMVIKCEQAAASALKSIRSNRHRNTETPVRRSLSMTLDKRLYGVINTEGITLTGPVRGKRVTVPFSLYEKAGQMLRTFKACDPTLFMRDGRFFLSVPFEVPEKPCVNDDCIGVDLGMRRLFVTSDGVAFRDATYADRRRKVRYLKSNLQSKKSRGSKRLLRKLRRRERNLSKDMCHRAANALVASTGAGVIVMEDLSRIKGNTSKAKDGHKRKRHNSAMSQVPFYMFRKIVEHKAQLAGKRVETVSPTYTSQTDSRTGQRNGERRGRRYICSDGTVLDSDWNAAINIAQRANHPVSKNLPVDGRLSFLSGRAQSTVHTPKASKSYGKPTNLFVGS